VSFAVSIPSKVGSAKARTPRYVSPATAVVQISVNGGPAQSFPVSGGQPCSNPSPPPGSGTCAVYSVQAPVGTDTFTISLLDNANHVLSAGTTQATIVQDQTNSVNVVFNGVPASLSVSVSNPSPPTGTAASFQVVPQVYDAAGFTIIGAPGALPTITITDSDTSGVTGLYLAGSDNTCATQAAAPATSVTTTVTTVNGNSFYTNVCLAYNGQALPNGATLTASASGVPSATATFKPVAQTAGTGAWMFGTDSNAQAGLVRFDPNMAPLGEITGSNAQLSVVNGLAVDAGANVFVLTQGPSGQRINEFASTANGNASPTASTDFSVPTNVPLQRVISGLALDGAGDAYIGAFRNGTTTTSCAIVLVPLTGSTSNPTVAADCSPYVDSAPTAQASGSITQLVSDGHGYLYAGYVQSQITPNPAIARYTIGAGGALTLDAMITGINPFFTVDSHGNVYAGGNNGAVINEYPASSFVHGQRTTVPSTPGNSYQNNAAPTAAYPDGVDGAGNLFAAKPAFMSGNSAEVIPAGSRVPSATANFVPAYVSGIFSASGGGGSPISAQPQNVETQSSAPITVSETGYTGTFTEIDDCGAIATVTPSSANGPTATFTVTSKHASGGTCTVTFSDAQHNTAPVHVGITVVNLTGSSKGRRPH